MNFGGRFSKGSRPLLFRNRQAGDTMREGSAKLGARVRRGLTSAEIVVSAVAGAVLVGGAVVVVPRVVEAGEGEAAGPRDVMPADGAHASSAASVREFVEAGGAVVHADGTAGEFVFWFVDEDDRGYANEDELIALRYSATLGAFTITQLESRESWSDRVDLAAVPGPELFSDFTSRDNAVTDVLSGGFEDVRLETTRQRAGEVTLGFAFTWGRGTADAEVDEAAFSVALPSIGGASGGGAGERP